MVAAGLVAVESVAVQWELAVDLWELAVDLWELVRRGVDWP
jgi:hypothetical protein